MLRLPRTRKADRMAEAERRSAELALNDARQSLSETRQLGTEVRAVSAELRYERRRNHFAPLVVEAIRKRHP